jgi:hypothetical protein
VILYDGPPWIPSRQDGKRHGTFSPRFSRRRRGGSSARSAAAPRRRRA